MLLYVFLVLGTWKGVLGEDDICDQPSFRVCVLPDGWRFPETEADLNQMCPQFMEYLDCLDDYLDKCTPEDGSKRKYYQGLRDLAKDVCQKDSQLHLRIVENMGCLNEVVQNEFGACQRYSYEKADAMIEEIDNIVAERGRHRELTHDETIPFSYFCLTRSIEVLCFINKSSARCGSDAKDIVLELFSRNGFIDRSCPGSSKKNIAEYISLLELELEEEAILKRILGKE